MAESQFNILGTPGASSQNLIANMTNRSGHTKQNTSGLLQTMLSNQSQERMARQSERGATQRSQLSADTALQQSGMAQQTAREQITSQEGMQAQQIDAQDKLAAAEIRAKNWQVKYTTNIQKELATREAELQEARFDYEQWYDQKRFSLAEQAQRSETDYNERVFEASTKLGYAQLEMQMAGMVMGLKQIQQLMGSSEAEAKTAEVKDNMITEYDAQAETLKRLADVIEVGQSKELDVNPGKLFSGDAAISTVAAGLKEAGKPINEVDLTNPSKVAEMVAKDPGIVMPLLQSTAGAMNALKAKRADIEANGPVNAPRAVKPSFFSMPSDAIMDTGPMKVKTTKQEQLNALDGEIERLIRLQSSINGLETSKMPVSGGQGTVGDSIKLYRSVWQGNTTGAVLKYAKDVLGLSDQRMNTMNMKDWSEVIISMMGDNVSPQLADQLRSISLSNGLDIGKKEQQNKVMQVLGSSAN